MKFPRLSLLTKISLIALMVFSAFYLLAYYSFKRITAKFERPIAYFPELLINAASQKSSNDNFTFVLLGQDPRDDKLEKTEVTDSILLAKYHPSTASLNLISLPRDIYDQTLAAKINQIFPLSKEKKSPDFIKQEFGRITGQEIDRYILLTTQNLTDIISLVGGVDVYLEHGFIDAQYPNPEYIKNPSPGTPIYKTVEFATGWHHLDASNVAEFVRSRKGGETLQTGGTDLARINRQQTVINALIEKLKSKELLTSLDTLSALYKYWSTQLTTDITDQDLVNLIVRPNTDFSKFRINRVDLPICPEKSCLFYHPQNLVNRQWVFIPHDNSYQAFHQYLNEKL